MRQLIVLSALAVALAGAGTASAGGFATVGVDPLPNGLEAGETWSTEITVLQHGRTPLDGLSPILTIREEGTGLVREFKASAASRTGVYEARVVFPEAGRWNVVVDPRWWGEARLTFGPVTIGDSPTGVTNPGAFPVVPLAAAGLALALLAVGAFGIRRVWRPTPASR